MLETIPFGPRLRDLRIQAGFSRERLAEIVAGFGVGFTLSARTIEGLEQGRYQDPGWQSVQALATALGVTPDAFLRGPASSAPLRRGRPARSDVLNCLPNWSDQNLRWLIGHLVQRYEKGGGYRVMQREACAERDKRKTTGETVTMNTPVGSRFVLIGVEEHEFGRFKRELDCEELAETMGLAIAERPEYFGHALIRRASRLVG